MKLLQNAIDYFKINIGETERGYFDLYNSKFKFAIYEANDGTGINYRIHANKIEIRKFNPLALDPQELNKLIEVINIIKYPYNRFFMYKILIKMYG